MTRYKLLGLLVLAAFAGACGDNPVTAPVLVAPRFARGVTGGGTGAATASLTGSWQDPAAWIRTAPIGPGSPFSESIIMVVAVTLKQSGGQITGTMRIIETNLEFGPGLPAAGQLLVNGPVGRPAKVTGSLLGSSVALTVTGDMFDARQPNLVRTLMGTLSADGKTITGVSGSIIEMPNIGTNWSFVRL